MNTRTRREKALQKVVGNCTNCCQPVAHKNAIPNITKGMIDMWDEIVCTDCARIYVSARILFIAIWNVTHGYQILQNQCPFRFSKQFQEGQNVYLWPLVQ